MWKGRGKRSSTMATPPPLPQRPPPSILPRGAGRGTETSPVDSDAPPVPTTPRPNLTLPPRYNPAVLPPHDQSSTDDRLTLSRLIKEFSHRFPLQVKVVKGFYGDRGEDTAIAADEAYNIHFVKRAKVITIRDIINNTHIVPLNSSCRFGIVYLKPGSTAPVVHTFDTVEQIIKAEPMPQVVAAKADYKGDSKKSSVNKGEILIINGTQKAKLGIGKMQLRVFSLTNLEEKLLSKDCIGLFTTEPYRVQMYLPELVEHFPNLIRSKARLYLDFDESNHGLPDYLISEVVTIVKESIETSVIASLVCEEEEHDPYKGVSNDDDDKDSHENLVDIPESLDIELEIVDPDEHDYMDVLYQTTDSLLKDFDPTLSYSYVAQNQVFSAIRKGHENTGLNIETPLLLSSASAEVRSTEGSQKPEQIEDISLDPDDYVDVDRELHRKSLVLEAVLPPHRSAKVRSASATEPDDQPPTTTPPPVPTRKPVVSVSRSASMQIPMHARPYENFKASEKIPDQQQSSAPRRKISPKTHPKPSPPNKESGPPKPRTLPRRESKTKSDNELKDLREEVTLLKDSIEQLTMRVMALEKGQSVKAGSKQNNSSLTTLNAAQILKFLDQMGMEKYKVKFTQEKVDGELLAECDESTLETELGVCSKLDRIKIMKVIRGKQSALDILGGRGAYVLFELKTDQ